MKMELFEPFVYRHCRAETLYLQVSNLYAKQIYMLTTPRAARRCEHVDLLFSQCLKKNSFVSFLHRFLWFIELDMAVQVLLIGMLVHFIFVVSYVTVI